MQHLETEHRAPVQVRAGRYDRTDLKYQLVGPCREPRRVAPTNLGEIPETPYEELECMLKEVAHLEQQPQHRHDRQRHPHPGCPLADRTLPLHRQAGHGPHQRKTPTSLDRALVATIFYFCLKWKRARA